MHVAVKADNMEVTRLLVASGANLAATDSSGETPACHAARHGHAAQLELLMTAGASLTVCNKVSKLCCFKLISYSDFQKKVYTQ